MSSLVSAILARVLAPSARTQGQQSRLLCYTRSSPTISSPAPSSSATPSSATPSSREEARAQEARRQRQLEDDLRQAWALSVW
ncbi:uncharacterized protein RHOBADRAFT_66837 [Rhodotorula graminis WP1]|uniref:Uncharacterized protein n=1 Tax=Rhodotorula graminis (strain WP1) TaxID=578459 RepID=A0A0N8PZM9_RHOGW|nr:uncharacterized protein RHOBADRAFT_66837 [Rhodotorula graminis WP1]KPV72773.1 hypothetical protein RHOBADRAFT_66837 [Rhodotorula graminis WP1]